MTQAPLERLIEAKLTLLLDRLHTAVREGRGLHLHGKEIALVCAVASLAQDSPTTYIINRITEQEDARDE